MHDEPSIKVSISELSAQITSVDTSIRSIYETLGLAPPLRYFRPGCGFFNKEMRQLAASLGYRIILGSIYPHDPQIHNPKVNSWHITSMADRGGVIIVHDRRGYTCETLERSLPRLRDMGYKIVTVSELILSTGGWLETNGSPEDD